MGQPPHTYQADVETVHRIIEDEFFEIETFTSTILLIDKAAVYTLWFNVAGKNSYKNHKTPWHIIHEREPTINPRVAILPAIPLDQILKKKLVKPNLRGYDVVQYP